MGVSESVDEGGGITDCSVGTIVWVRRRNGSWWPGRILGPEELAASHLMSPRSGTPVKLLGREDASVDWYNLEKSKRVKAFRCGEFDACIERAEASQGVPIKKREKYARREDAILHALELEKMQLQMKQKNSGIMSNGSSIKHLNAPKKDFNFSSSDISIRNDGSGFHSKTINKSLKLSRKPSLVQEEKNMSDPMFANNGKGGKQMGCDKDTPESIPRMRGLQDFGLQISPKKKLLQSIALETSRRPSGNDTETFPSTNHIMEGAGHINFGNNTLAIKRKRSHGGIIDESLVKKRDRRRPLVQVLQSSAKLQACDASHLDHDPSVVSLQGEKDNMGVVCRAKRSKCIYLPADSDSTWDHGGYPSEETANQFGTNSCLNRPSSLAQEYTSSVMFGMNESDSSGREYLETNMEDETDLLGDTSQSLAPGSKGCEDDKLQVSEKFRDMDHKEVPLPSYMPQLQHYEQSTDASASAEVGVSKWHMKGKRNVRNLAKKPVDVIDGKISLFGSEKCNGSLRETTYEAKGNRFKMGEMDPSSHRKTGFGFHHNKKHVNYASDEVDLIDEDLNQKQIITCNNDRYPSALKSVRDHGRSHTSFNDLDNDSRRTSRSVWEADGLSFLSRRSYWEESYECYDPVYPPHLSKERGSMLVDVDLKVQASYQGEHVPLVSLMSRLNGKAIIGHPVQIEILEDGSTSQYFSSSYNGPNEGAAAQPAWRTARRTAMQRVPRSSPVTSALEDEDDGVFQHSDRESRPPSKKYSVHFNIQLRLAKKSFSHAYRAMSEKFQKKSIKRLSLASKKTRTLSSIATEHRRSGHQTSDAKPTRGILGGLIKPEGTVPLVTCVPVKVAFSRILEAVGRPSAVAHRPRMTTATMRDPC